MELRDRSYIVFDDNSWFDLLPLTFTRPVSEIRIGILTIREKWEILTGHKLSWKTQDFLSRKYPFHAGRINILVNGSVIPDKNLISEINGLKPGEILSDGPFVVAACVHETDNPQNLNLEPEQLKTRQIKTEYVRISKPWHIFQLNGQVLKSDYHMITRNRNSAKVSKTNRVLMTDNVFVEEGARLEYVTINGETGPVYIGKDTEIMEGAMIRGPFALCEGSTVKMGAKIYGPTTIGPHSKVGGEITNAVLFAYSNKVHDGFLGNAVVGEWCNIGADTNASNLKNDYTMIKVWSYTKKRFEKTDLQFCGLIMGDYSRCGINTMFNSGTVVGICTNIYGAGFPRSFISSFSKGGPAGFSSIDPEAVFLSVERAMMRRNYSLRETDKDIIRHVYRYLDRYPATG